LKVYLLALVLPQLAMAGPTYYVDCVNGDDTYSALQAQNLATPWKTIKKAMDTGGLTNITKKNAPLDGYTVVVQAGVCSESVESKRDGLPGNPVILRAASPGTVTIRPPAGLNGIFISHHHHMVDGFIVTGATIGLKMGPHDGGDGPTAGLVARNNRVTGNSNNGIQFTNAVDGVAEFNTVTQNGSNGISYSGDGATIHDNVVQSNSQFGIYIKDGVDHRLWNNVVSNNAKGDLKIQGATLPPPGGRTFYVGIANGDDTRTEVQAQNPATPWKTIRRGLQAANAGDIVAILPGLYSVTVESIRDGAAGAPITIKAVTPGDVTITPPSGSGVYIGHNYNIVDGLVLTGASTHGLQMGPYKANGDPPVTGVVARNNLVFGNGVIGIKFTNAIDSAAMHNVVRDNGKDGIWYSGSGATLFNNLVYGNGKTLTGEFGITLTSGDRHQVLNNTVYGNLNGGIRLGTSNSIPVFSTVLNNIVVKNAVGIREPAGSDYTGRATLDYNDVYNNTTNYALSAGSGTVKGSHSISLAPGFVDPANGDFGLGRKATGQLTDSPVIDKGSDKAEALGLGGRTAFTDKYPDTGQVDLGYHKTLLNLTEGTTTVSQATVTLSPSGEDLTVAATLQVGAGTDGVEPGTEYVEVGVGGFLFFLPPISFQGGGGQWSYAGSGGVSGTLAVSGNSVAVSLQASGLAAETTISTSTGISVRMGDDFGATAIPLRGVLQYP
jgi:parallel beta-helix repeat protein